MTREKMTKLQRDKGCTLCPSGRLAPTDAYRRAVLREMHTAKQAGVNVGPIYKREGLSTASVTLWKRELGPCGRRLKDAAPRRNDRKVRAPKRLPQTLDAVNTEAVRAMAAQAQLPLQVTGPEQAEAIGRAALAADLPTVEVRLDRVVGPSLPTAEEMTRRRGTVLLRARLAGIRADLLALGELATDLLRDMDAAVEAGRG